MNGIDTTPTRWGLGATGTSAGYSTPVSAAPAAVALLPRRKARRSSSAASEEGSSDPFLELLHLSQSPDLEEEDICQILSSLTMQDELVGIALLYVCANERITLGIIQCFIENFPRSVRAGTLIGKTPLYLVCRNKHVTADIVRCLINKYEDALPLQDENGDSPLFHLCMNDELDESVAEDILKLILEKRPELAKQRCSDGSLPIMTAIGTHSPKFCRELMDAYPRAIHHEYGGLPMLNYVLVSPLLRDDRIALYIIEMLVGKYPDLILRFRCNGLSSLHMIAGVKIPRSAELCSLLLRDLPELVDTTTVDRCKPLHIACTFGNLPVVKCILDMCPNAIDETASNGGFPIHFAVSALERFPNDAVEVIKFLLTDDVNVASQTFFRQGITFPLCLACYFTNASNLSVGLQVIKLLHDAYPKAIATLGGLRVAAEVADFLHLQLRYVGIANDRQLVATPYENGNLPIHQALYDGVALGTMKLLADADNSTLLTPTPNNGNTLLHEACRRRDYGLIQMLLTQYPTEQVHTQNDLGELPIQVLIESDTNEPESADHLSSIFLLLKASPAVLMSGTDLRSE